MSHLELEQLRQVIAEVKRLNRLEDVVRSHGVDLKRSGRGERYEGCCPFHEDDSPSLSVYTATQHYRCYGCDASGDVIDFVRLYYRCSLMEALERLGGKLDGADVASRPSVPVPSHPVQRPARKLVPQGEVVVHTQEHTTILSYAQQVYYQALLRSAPVQEYLRERGITHSGVELSGLGYADGLSLRAALRGKTQLWQAARKAGLLTRTGKEWLRGRLVFPDFADGLCIWMIGRLIPGQEGQAFYAKDKYLGLALPKPLIGYHTALAQIRAGRADRFHGILLQEGAFDYVLARQWNVPALCTALLGTYASTNQLLSLLHLHQESGLPLIDWHDGDERGGQAALHLLDQLSGVPVRVFPPLLHYKDMGDLGMQPFGQTLFAHAWLHLGDGGEL